MPTDQYDRMNTAQLENEASQRGINLDEFQQLKNNQERAQRLRDHDAATQATNEQAAENARQAQQRQEQADQQQPPEQAQQQPTQESGQANDSVQVSHGGHAGPYDQPQPTDQGGRTTGEGVTERLAAQADQTPTPRDVGEYDVAPYPTDRDAQNRIDAAAGQVTATPAHDEADVPQVGGQNRPTEDGSDPDLAPNRDR
jgi:hypothetical protein